MSVFTRKDGRVICSYYVDGEHVQEYFGRGDEAREAAEARDLEVRLKIKRGQMNIPASGTLTFVELAQMYIDDRAHELSDSSRYGIIRSLVKYALPVIGRKFVRGIDIQDWRNIQNLMVRSGVGNLTINTYFKYMSKVFSWAVDENDGILNEHPWRKRRPLKIKNRFRPELPTVKEFMAIHAAAAPHLAWIMEVAYYTGMRPGPSELFALKWTDVDWINGRVRVYSPKTDTERWIRPDAQEFMVHLKQKYKETSTAYPGCPWVCHFEGNHVRSVKKAWEAAKRRAGVKKRLRLYDIRHFHITYALAGGADIMELAHRVGHVDGTMIVKVYAQRAKELTDQKTFSLPSIYTDLSVDLSVKEKGHL